MVSKNKNLSHYSLKIINYLLDVNFSLYKKELIDSGALRFLPATFEDKNCRKDPKKVYSILEILHPLLIGNENAIYFVLENFYEFPAWLLKLYSANLSREHNIYIMSILKEISLKFPVFVDSKNIQSLIDVFLNKSSEKTTLSFLQIFYKIDGDFGSSFVKEEEALKKLLRICGTKTNPRLSHFAFKFLKKLVRTQGKIFLLLFILFIKYYLFLICF